MPLFPAQRLTVRQATRLLLFAAMVTGAQPVAAQGPAGRRPPRPHVVVIDSVSVVDVAAQRILPLQRIVIRGDSIVAVQSVALPAPDSVDERISGRGAFAIPGLVDHHVHLAPSMERALERGARGGVTMVQAMAGDNRTAGEYARAIMAKELLGPEIAYASVMAGPDFFTDPRFIGAGLGYPPGEAPWARAVSDTTNFVQAVAAARGSGAEVLKLYAMMDSALAAQLTAEAHRQGMRVVAHGTVFPARPLQLVQSGVDILTHVPYLSWQGAAVLQPEDAWDRRDGPYAAVPPESATIAALVDAMQQHGTVLEPTLWVFSRAGVDSVVSSWGRAVTARAHAAGVTIVAGTDGFVGADTVALPTIHEELQQLVHAGLTPGAALASATIVPARVMQRERTHGAIAPGHVADIVLLERDPLADIRATTAIRAVVLRGRPLRR